MRSTPGSFAVGSAQPGAKEGAPRRCYLNKGKDHLVDGNDLEIPTAYDVVKRAARLFGNQNGLGERELIKLHTEEKEVTKMVKGQEKKEMKKWQYYEMTDYKYQSYNQFLDNVHAVGSGLRALGLSKDTMFNIYSATGLAWQTLAIGCASQSITFATAYDSLGEEGLKHSLNEPEVVGIFTNGNLLGTLAAVIADTPTVKVVVYDHADEAKSADLDTLRNAREGIQVVTLDELKALGKKENHAPTPPTQDDICCIMYTSGSTGAPKGVILSHKNVCASVAAVHYLLEHLLQPGMTYIAYLPLAHIFEFVVELIMIHHSIVIGYGNVKTLTDTSMRNCLGDMRCFKPTIMVGVPAVWEQIRKGILTKVKEGGKSGLFNAAMTMKRNSTLLGHIADAVVFKKVKEATGGRLKYALSGGAPISKDTQEFLQTALVTMLQGYGMTESSAMCAILPPEYLQQGVAGVPVPCAEIKLVDVSDMNYTSDTSDGSLAQGEIYLRGPSITKGYFKREDLTKEALSDDGWLMTGDIGQWNADGTLSIIDRKKNLVKLSGGEYIALEKLETTYSACNLLMKICLHADPDAKQPMAIAFPNEKNLRSAAKEHGFADNEDLRTLCEDDRVRQLVLDELNSIGKKSKFKQMELIQAVILDPEEWTPKYELTAAQKLQRRNIVKKFDKEIKAVYP